MECAILIPATNRKPRSQKEASERKISKALFTDFVQTLRTQNIHVEGKPDESRILYPSEYRPDIQKIAENMEIRLCICIPPKNPKSDGLIL